MPSSAHSATTGRVTIDVALDVAEILPGSSPHDPRRPTGRPRRIAAADGRDDRRRRPPGRERDIGSDHGCLHDAPGRRPGPRARRHEVLRRDALGVAGGSAGDPEGGMGCRDDLLHRLEGPQRPDPRDGGAQGPEAERVRPVRGRDRRADRRRDRDGGLRATRPAVHRTDASRGSRRGRGGPRRRAAPGPHPEADARRPAHAHEPHRRCRHPRTDAGGRGRASATPTTP